MYVANEMVKMRIHNNSEIERNFYGAVTKEDAHFLCCLCTASSTNRLNGVHDSWRRVFSAPFHPPLESVVSRRITDKGAIQDNVVNKKLCKMNFS